MSVTTKKLTKSEKEALFNKLSVKAKYTGTSCQTFMLKHSSVVLFSDPDREIVENDLVLFTVADTEIEYVGYVHKIKPLNNRVGINPFVCLHFKELVRNPTTKMQRTLKAMSKKDMDRFMQNKQRHINKLDSLIAVLERESGSQIKDYKEDEDEPEIISMDDLAREEETDYGYR